MTTRYVEFYGTLPNGTAGPAVVYGFPSGGTVQVGNTGDTASNYTISVPFATGTIALLQANQVWTGTQDFTGASVTVPTMPFGDDSTHAASTAFVLAGLNAIAPIHGMCQVASQVNVTVSAPGALIDGYAPALNDRVLLVGQTAGAENGPWLWKGAAVPMVRPSDWISGATDLANFGVGFDVLYGNTNPGTFWYVSTTGAITIDTTVVAFSKFAWNIGDGFSQGVATVPHGGTGVATLTANQVLIGNGTSAVSSSPSLTFSSNNLTYATLTATAASTTNGTIWTDSTQKALGTYQNGLGGMVPQVIFTATADASVNSTVTPTSILGTGVGTKTLPANWPVIAKQVRIVVDGYYTSAGNPTSTLAFKLGSTTISTGTIASTPSATNGKVSGELLLTFRTIGATGTVSAGGVLRFTTTGGASTSIPVVATAATTIDTTVSQAIDLVFTWGTAGSNVITIQQALIVTAN